MMKGSAPVADIPEDIAALGFEEALAELERIVRQLEEGKGKLDEAIEAYGRGVALKRHCETKLAQAQARVESIMVGADGALSSRPIDPA